MGRNLRGSFSLAAADAKVQAAARQGLFLAAEHVLQVSTERVPLEEGTLMRTAKTSMDDDGMTAAVSYDGPYAAYQHERMDLRHPNGRQAKFLESSMLSERETAGEIIASTVRGELG